MHIKAVNTQHGFYSQKTHNKRKGEGFHYLFPWQLIACLLLCFEIYLYVVLL